MTQSIAGELKRQIVGQITANGTNEVTIQVPNLQADSILLASVNTISGTAGNPVITTKDASTNTAGFTSVSGDTSVYDIIYLS